jgi:hypothetical protein
MIAAAAAGNRPTRQPDGGVPSRLQGAAERKPSPDSFPELPFLNGKMGGNVKRHDTSFATSQRSACHDVTLKRQ